MPLEVDLVLENPSLDSGKYEDNILECLLNFSTEFWQEQPVLANKVKDAYDELFVCHRA